MLALIRHSFPMSSATAIRIARQHALETCPGIELEAYSISAPSRSDWFEEWGVQFRHESGKSGFVILVTGGDIYNGSKVRVFLDRAWENKP